MTPAAAYLHIPFCDHHCAYCDFAVIAGRNDLMEDYLHALEREFTTLKSPRAVRTIFIGGGTPTTLTPHLLDRFLSSVNHWFPRERRVEFSIESTPDSLDADKVAILAEHGVTRVSIGVQSFHAGSLSGLDRRHRAEQIPVSIELVRHAGLEISLDLIFAAPGSTLKTWQDDLTTALSYSPDHMSTYGLTYETGTPLWKQRKAGTVLPIVEDVEADMYSLAIDTLTAAGYEHYEISNFAKPGKRCRHNETYWANDPYFGFGVGAAAFVDGVRTLNVRNTIDYIRRLNDGRSPVFQSENLTGLDAAAETLMVQMRRKDGVNWADVQSRTGIDLRPMLSPSAERLQSLGLIEMDAFGLRFRRPGMLISDSVLVDLLKVIPDIEFQ